MKQLTSIAAGMALALSVGTSAFAQEVTLTASSWVPPSHVFYYGVLKPWADTIEAESDGRIKIDILPQPVASPPGHYDAVRDQLVDIAFNSPTYLPGKMPLTVFGQMPFEAANTTAHSLAFERTYQAMIAPTVNEYQGVVNLGTWWSGPGQVWTSDRAITDLASFEGAKIRVAGPMAQSIMEGVGAVPIFKPATEVYELISGGVVDGVMFPGDAVCGFKVDEIVSNLAQAEGGIYSDMFFLMINQDAYAGLSDENRAVIDKYSGEYIAELGGTATDKDVDACMEKVTAAGISVNPLADDARAAIQAAVAPAAEAWSEAAAAAGLDGEAILARYHAELDALASN